jgi:alkylation response protein AidB-like acyl-CoA dehydrogenase
MSTAPDAAAQADTQRQIVALAREFAESRIAPAAAEWDRAAHFPRDVLHELGTLGFLGMLTPEAYDGLGLDTVTYLLALEEIAAADAGLALSVSLQHTVQAGLLLPHGTETQRGEWLGPLARGDKIAAIAQAEPDGGSDIAAIQARAARQGDAWLLSGAKAWVTNGATADVAIVFARSAAGVTAFVVPTGAPGYRPGARADQMGLRTASMVPVTLDALRLPEGQLLGEDGAGLAYALEAAELSRLGTAIIAVGIARCALERSVAYCGERRQFGQLLHDFEAVQFKLADMATRTAAARALAHAAAARRDRGPEPAARVGDSVGMAKLYASETAMWVTTQAVQLFGGYGYMRDFPVEKLFRDAKGTELADGTSELLRVAVARSLQT